VLFEVTNRSPELLKVIEVNCTVFNAPNVPIGVNNAIVQNLKPSEADRGTVFVSPVAPSRPSEGKSASCRIVNAY
jgi:hypothetical protein